MRAKNTLSESLINKYDYACIDIDFNLNSRFHIFTSTGFARFFYNK